MTHNQNGIHLRVRWERAIDELRRGRPIAIADEGAGALVFAAETVDRTTLIPWLSDSSVPAALVISAERARAIGFDAISHVRTALGPLADVDWMLVEKLGLAAQPDQGDREKPACVLEPADTLCNAAIELLKQAKLLPAALVLPIAASNGAKGANNGHDNLAASVNSAAWCTLTPTDIQSYSESVSSGLRIAARARIPLDQEEQCEFIVFNDGAGSSEHVAVLVGSDPLAEPALLRLHSACLTGDVFNSLRCDCGDQLRGSLDVMVEAGGGILLYLPQEGRGIGLTNKLRAYALQDRGMDTLDADALLGFSPDERTYEAAAEMLRQLGVTRVRLMTNSPHKVEALRGSGVQVEGRLSLSVAPNRHNVGYLRVKASRAGHWLDDL